MGRPWPDPIPKTLPLQLLFRLRKRHFLGVPERGGFGEENCLGRGGVDREKKRKKDAQKKLSFYVVSLLMTNRIKCTQNSGFPSGNFLTHNGLHEAYAMNRK